MYSSADSPCSTAMWPYCPLRLRLRWLARSVSTSAPAPANTPERSSYRSETSGSVRPPDPHCHHEQYPVTPVSRWNPRTSPVPSPAGQSAPARESPPRRLRADQSRSRRKRAPHRMADQAPLTATTSGNHHPQRLGATDAKSTGTEVRLLPGSQARAAHYRRSCRLHITAKPYE